MAGRSKIPQRCRERIKVQQEVRYSDPAYLPHIPFGDLAHLSDERNTGAARDKLHEVYRCPLSTT